MLRTLKFLFIIYLSAAQLAAQDKKHLIDSLLKERGEVYVSLGQSRLKTFIKPSQLPGFDLMKGDSVFLYLTRRDSSFILQNIDILKVMIPPSMQLKPAMSNEREKVLKGEAYPTYPLYLEIMEYFRDSFPDLCTIDTIGYTTNGRFMLAARIGKYRDSPGLLPIAFYSSTIHGDEPPGYVFMLMLIQHILTNNTPELAELLESLTIIINPLENPDGCYFLSDTTIVGATRGNANGVNLNRNFPDPQDGEHPDRNPWQVETINMMKYLERYPPSISANFHSGAELVNYPYDTWALLHPDNDWFRLISLEYASQAYSKFPGYMDDFPDGIVNGFTWYEIDGGRQDFVTYFLRGRETTIELSTRKFIPEDEILKYWEANRESLLSYLKQGMYGIHGTVSDSATSKGLRAEVTITDHDSLNSSVFSDSIFGIFFRYLKAGDYRLSITAPGYMKHITNLVRVNDYERTELEIRLSQIGALPLSDSMKIGPNPFIDEFTIYLETVEATTAFFTIYDMYGMVRLEEFAVIPAGYFEHVIHPSLPAGLYFLEIRFGTLKKTLRIVKLRSDK